jgi:hypothetical protein
MVKRGRKSAAELAAPKVSNLLKAERLKPPAHLTDAEISVWNEIVSDQPANAFTPTHAPLIQMYCRQVVNGRILADEILNFDRSWLASDEGLKRYDKLLGMAERESRAASSLATRMRITRQAIDQQTVARMNVNSTSKTKKPWELPETIDMEE